MTGRLLEYSFSRTYDEFDIRVTTAHFRDYFYHQIDAFFVDQSAGNHDGDYRNNREIIM